MSHIKVSIIMPSLNVGKYIKDCLDSVIRQSLKDIEIICVDAGSTDGTLQVLEEFARRDSRIKIINSSMKSYGFQMNLGIDAAVGEYIGIVETDDYIDTDMFEKMYQQITYYDVDYIKGVYIGFVEKDEIFEKKHSDAIDARFLSQRLDLNTNRKLGILSPVHIWSGLYRRKFLVDNNIRFNETLGASFQDTSFSILVGMLADSCVYTDDTFYHYRMDNINSSVKSASKINCVVEEYAYVVNKLLELGKYSNEVKEIVERFKLNTYIWNYNRLNADGRHTFLDLINDEMQDYIDNHINWELSSVEKKRVQVLTDHSLVEKDIEKKAEYCSRVKSFIEDCRKGEKFNIVGAGRIFDKFANIQSIIKCEFIAMVSDNSVNIQNTEVNGYKVNSVDWTIQNSKYDNWIILNKNNSKEIFDQLVNLGIDEDSIRVFDQIIDSNIVMECLYDI